MFKKITAILIAVCMVISLSACKKVESDTSSTGIQIGGSSVNEGSTDVNENEESSEDETVKNEVSNLISEKNKLNSEITTLKKQISEIQTQINSLKSQKTDVTSVIAELRKKLENAQCQLDQCNEEINAINLKISSAKTDKNNNATDNNSSQNGNTSSGNTSEDNKPSTDNNKKDPADYKGTTIQFAHTFPNFSDDGATGYVVEKFEKEYGIKVELVYCSIDNYANELSGLISAGKAPTVGRSNGDYPACLGYFQSLDAAKIDYTDDIWNQNTFKLTTYNGAPYMCDTVGNYWTKLDLVVYSKSALKAANCPTPEELDKAGNWNFDSFLQIGQKLKQKDANNKGISFHNYDVILNMTGGSVYKLGSDNHIVNGIDNNTTAIMQKLATAKKGGYFSIGGASDLITGSAGIITDSTWCLRKDGDLKSYGNYNDLGFYYLPAYKKGGATPATGVFRGWGIIKGCNENSATGSKAAVAGGIFLRYYLDVNNYNLNNAFISKEAENFFYEITVFYSETDNYNPYLTYCGLNNGVSGIDPQRVVYTHMNDDPSQIPSQMASVKSKVQNGVDNLNDYIIKNVRTQ